MKRSTSSKLPRYIWEGKEFKVNKDGLINMAQGNTCSICKFVYNKPVQICKANASHLTCLKCAEELKANKLSCPLCRGKLLDEFKVNKAVATSINNLSVICHHKKCNQSIDVSEVESHMKMCPEEKVVCPGECGEPRIKRRKLEKHKKKCSRYMNCECGDRILKNESKENGDILKKHIASKPVERHPLLHLALNCWVSEQRGSVSVATQTDRDSRSESSSVTGGGAEPVTFAGISCMQVSGERGLYRSINDARTFFAIFDLPKTVEDISLVKEIKYKRILFSDYEADAVSSIVLRRYKNYPQILNLSVHNQYLGGNVNFTVYSGPEQRLHTIVSIDEKKTPPDTEPLRAVQPFRNNQYLIKVEV